MAAGRPSRLVDRLKWSPDCSAAQVPTGAIVLPFAGKDDAASLEAILHSQAPGLSSRFLAFDSCRKPEGKDLLDDGLYGALCTAALHGVISFVGACPDFCTWGKDRWFQDSGRFHAERARNPRDAWGIQALPAEASRTADEESLLLLRFLLLSWLAAKASSLAGEPHFRCFLELAEDPARGATSPARKRCSSAWATPALQAWTADLGLSVLHFDLCSFGFFERRPTRAVTNLPLDTWDGRFCTHSVHMQPTSSGTQGIRRPESMLKEIAASLVRTLHGPSVERLAHAASNPTDSDCAESLGKEHDRWTDLGAAPAGAAVHPALPSLGGQRQEAGSPGAGTQAGDQFLASPEIGSDRPSTLPLSESLSLDDATMRVSHGFKVRPLRDGGGKTSPGRLPPHLRTGACATGLGDFT